jgi:hypothetical protein
VLQSNTCMLKSDSWVSISQLGVSKSHSASSNYNRACWNPTRLCVLKNEPTRMCVNFTCKTSNFHTFACDRNKWKINSYKLTVVANGSVTSIIKFFSGQQIKIKKKYYIIKSLLIIILFFILFVCYFHTLYPFSCSKVYPSHQCKSRRNRRSRIT